MVSLLKSTVHGLCVKFTPLSSRKCFDVVLVLVILGLLSSAGVKGQESDADVDDLCSRRKFIQLNSNYGEIISSTVDLRRTNDCQLWLIQGTTGSTISIRLKDFYPFRSNDFYPWLYRSGNCSSAVELTLGSAPLGSAPLGSAPEQKVCRMSDLEDTYHSQGDHVWVKFRIGSIYYSSQPRFQLEYMSSSSSRCKDQCGDGMCLFDGPWRCNGVNQCKDGSDAIFCKFQSDKRDQMTTSRPSKRTALPLALTSQRPYQRMFGRTTPPPISLKNRCPYGDIYCQVIWKSSRYMCLHNVHKCDGRRDCEGNEDERNCGNELCNRLLGSTGGYVAPPRYDSSGFTTPGYNCTWVIHPEDPLVRVIQLELKFFHPPSALLDRLDIYDGPDSTYPLVGSYQSDPPPFLIKSKSSWLTLKYRTSFRSPIPRFNFTYRGSRKGDCLSGESRCGDHSTKCYNLKQACDGYWDCPEDGADEIGCGDCPLKKYRCAGHILQCYSFEDRCTGHARCPNKADQANCTSAQCNSNLGTFLCDNNMCIYESWVCDKRDDCGDNSDEVNCSASTKRVIIAAITGSMICALLLVVLLGCSCKIYYLRNTERHACSRHETPMSRMYAEFLRRRAPPPYHEAMLTSRNFDEVQQEYQERMRNSNRRHRRSHRRQGSGRNGDQAQNGDNDASTDGMGAGGENGVQNSENGENSTQTSASRLLCTIIEESENRNHDHLDRTSSTADLLQSGSSDSESGDSDSDHGNDLEDERHRGHENEGCNGHTDHDDDDDNILTSTCLSARWATPTDGNESDDPCLLAEPVSENNNDNDSNDDDDDVEMLVGLNEDVGDDLGQLDTVSVDTGSASEDSLEMTNIPLPATSFIRSDNEDSASEKEDSRPSSPKPDSCHSNTVISGEESARRNGSQDSLNSYGWETGSENEVPMHVLN